MRLKTCILLLSEALVIFAGIESVTNKSSTTHNSFDNESFGNTQ
ncbi:MAG: hypothetical protein Q8S84_06765 [bacterium]|nr:hypothetical protein [bacterium]